VDKAFGFIARSRPGSASLRQSTLLRNSGLRPTLTAPNDFVFFCRMNLQIIIDNIAGDFIGERRAPRFERSETASPSSLGGEADPNKN